MDKIHFTSEVHKAFWEQCLSRSHSKDAYHQAFFYAIGMSAELRGNLNSLFDFEQDSIRPEALDAAWQTGGTRRVTFLAFNLWNGYVAEGQERYSTPYEMFDCGFAPYMWEAIKLRYPEYARTPR